MHKFIFLDNTANCFELFFCGNTSSVIMDVKQPIWTIVSTWKRDQLQNQYICFPQAWVLNGGYYNRTCCIFWQYPTFSLVDYHMYV